MKIIFTLFILLVVVSNVFGQYTEQPDYSKLPSIVFPPANYSPSPLNTESSTITTSDGYDNFFLGVDFGEPHIATNPTDPKNSATAYNINNYYVTLNGIDWVKKGVSFPSSSAIGDPVLTYDSLGNLYYVQLYQIGSLYGIWVAKSTDKGLTFGAAVSATSTTVGLNDKEWICADQTGGPYSNYLYLGWRQFGATGMRVSRSTDFGATWSSPVTMTGDQGAYVCVGANGNVQGGNVYFGCTSGSTIRVYVSTNGGASFSAGVSAVTGIAGPGVTCAGRNTMKSCIRTDYMPRMAADNSYTSSRGNVYVVYAANPAGADLASIYLARSTNYGVTWSTPVVINDDATTTDQWEPAISVDKKSGKVFVYWFDSRNDPTGNLLTEMWGTHSTDGGVTFATNYRVSNVQFNPNSMAVGQPGGEKYIGDYIGNSSVTSSTSMNSYMDARYNTLGSFVSYGPDFAMQTNLTQKYLNNNDSVSITVKVPSTRGGFNERVKFVLSLDTLPASGSIQLSFKNGKDTITAFPDSVRITAKTVGSVTPKSYLLNIVGSGITGIPTHRRTVELIVNSSYLNVGTNREGISDFKVNGSQFNTRQNLLFVNGTSATIQALSPKVSGGYQYTYLNWSDAGDTTHTINVTAPFSLTANYKVAYKLVLSSIAGNTFGGGLFYDSAAAFTFGVTGKIVNYNGNRYMFKGWTGSGAGSYNSPDSTGNDTTVTLLLSGPIAETARWTQIVGISNLGTEVPNEWKLYQNYPNPFNPETKVNFDVLKEEGVKITVYDALGREVETLVNEKLSPGRYNVTFNGAKYSSGIYFYRLTSNSFKDIKKMLLIK
ncbi:MAG: T9SS type A sorting domain-containing protein [Ignavibacteriae bacterium]|nr:T9SS type A sorting domain-containing protein [Ignavibacteriota bacterium]